VALRVGMALDNARLFTQQRQLAEGLQRSLLTAPPEPDHMQVAVRYAPAAEAAQVGGDWYDAFLQLDGATVLVIGDVVGHDTAAAAAMGQLRSLLRGIAAHTGEGPADVLRGVDRAMATLQVDTTASVIVARVEQSADEKERGLTHVRWSNAGHPPPMAINPDGTVVVLAGVEADLLLGIDHAAERIESSISLDRGSTVLLYTDGLVERRGQSLDEGLARLRQTLTEVADLELDALCDAVLARLLPDHPEDDVALVAVRLHRQDQPRPPEAGPQVVPAIVDDER
jgi:serine phosphatase RsbU (regulator of sigma subunit)